MKRFITLALTLIGLLVLLTSITPPPLESQTNAVVYFGVWANCVTPPSCGNAPWDSSTLNSFEADAGKKVSIVHWGQPWWSNNAYTPFSWASSQIDAMRAHGSLALIDWSPWDTKAVPLTVQSQFSLGAIIRGDHDGYIKTWAQAAALYNKPFFIRLMHEMNATWFPWSESVNGNQPGQYVAAWRHIHDIFINAGATKVAWVWCPNNLFQGSAALTGLYPGDAYVDWTCMDAYNFGGTNWKSFDQIVGPTYAALESLAPTKPIMLGEWAGSEAGGDKASWILDAYQKLKTYPNIGAAVWFNWNAETGRTWTIESSLTSLSAHKTAMADTYYASNSFGGVSGNIQPLRQVASLTPTRTSTWTITPTSTPIPLTPTFTSTLTPTSTSTFTPTFTASPTNTATNTPTPTFTNTSTPTSTPTMTPTPTPTNTPCWQVVYVDSQSQLSRRCN